MIRRAGSIVASAAVPVAVAAVCLLLGVGILAALGYPAGQVLSIVGTKILWPADVDRRLARWAIVLQDATPILFTGLAITVAFRAAVWNIGAQGQYILGAIAATAAGIHLRLPPALLIPAVLLSSLVAGAIFAAVAAVLETNRRVPVVLSTLLLNFVALELVRYLIQGPMQESGGKLQSDLIAASAFLPLIPGTRLHIGFLIALASAALIAFTLRWTTFGFRLRIVGENATAARFAGIAVPRVAVLTMALSGALAGLAGGIEIAGVTHQLQSGQAAAGVGFTGIAVALLGRLTASGTIAAAIFLGFLNTAARILEAEMGVPFAAGQAMQGMIVLLMLVLGQLHRRPGTIND